MHKTMGITVSTEDEVSGIDLAEHAETAYDLSGIGGGSRHGLPSSGVVAANTAPLTDSTKEGASA